MPSTNGQYLYDNTNTLTTTYYPSSIFKETKIFDVGKLVKIGSILCVVIEQREIRYYDMYVKRHLVHRLQEVDGVIEL